MKFHIISDGESRLRANAEFQKRLDGLRGSIHARYAAELMAAGPLRRLVLLWRMSVEFRVEAKKISPSPDSLYLSRIEA